jgi:hypothetical protein
LQTFDDVRFTFGIAFEISFPIESISHLLRRCKVTCYSLLIFSPVVLKDLPLQTLVSKFSLKLLIRVIKDVNLTFELN